MYATPNSALWHGSPSYSLGVLTVPNLILLLKPLDQSADTFFCVTNWLIAESLLGFVDGEPVAALHELDVVDLDRRPFLGATEPETPLQDICDSTDKPHGNYFRLLQCRDRNTSRLPDFARKIPHAHR